MHRRGRRGVQDPPTLAHAGDSDVAVPEVSGALDVLDAVTLLCDPHAPLERQGRAARLVGDARLPCRPVRLVHVGPLRDLQRAHVLLVLLLHRQRAQLRIQRVVEDHVPVDVGQRAVAFLGVGARVAVRLRVENDRVRPCPHLLRRGQRHHEHTGAVIGLVPVVCRVAELGARGRVVPAHRRLVQAAVVAVERDVVRADEVALVRHHRTLVVLVAHAPDSVLRVVIARELRLPPERGPQLLRAAPAHDEPEHLVLDVRPQDDDV